MSLALTLIFLTIQILSLFRHHLLIPSLNSVHRVAKYTYDAQNVISIDLDFSHNPDFIFIPPPSSNPLSKLSSQSATMCSLFQSNIASNLTMLLQWLLIQMNRSVIFPLFKGASWRSDLENQVSR